MRIQNQLGRETSRPKFVAWALACAVQNFFQARPRRKITDTLDPPIFRRITCQRAGSVKIGLRTGYFDQSKSNAAARSKRFHLKELMEQSFAGRQFGGPRKLGYSNFQ